MQNTRIIKKSNARCSASPRCTRNEREERKKKIERNVHLEKIDLNKEKRKKNKLFFFVEERIFSSLIVFEFKKKVFIHSSEEKVSLSLNEKNYLINFHLFIPIHPVNLSILFTGGKEIKRDTLSNGE
jgi:hypothetical protein